jgi:hypothetical protein
MPAHSGVPYEPKSHTHCCVGPASFLSQRWLACHPLSHPGSLLYVLLLPSCNWPSSHMLKKLLLQPDPYSVGKAFTNPDSVRQSDSHLVTNFTLILTVAV